MLPLSFCVANFLFDLFGGGKSGYFRFNSQIWQILRLELLVTCLVGFPLKYHDQIGFFVSFGKKGSIYPRDPGSPSENGNGT